MVRVAKMTAEVIPPASQRNRTLPVIIVLVFLLVVALVLAGYFYYQYHNTPQDRDAKEIATLTKEIGAVMELPEGETPTLATVTDKEKLTGQAFFQKAENGDKVLIYSNSGKAILYRPSTKKIVDVTTVNVNTPPAGTPAPPETPLPVTPPSPEPALLTAVRVTLYNGSEKLGATGPVEEALTSAFPNIQIVNKEKAAKTYTETSVIDLSGKNKDLALAIAQKLDASLGTFPTDETLPQDTDILVIVGQRK